MSDSNGRNNRLAQIAGRLRREGLDRQAIEQALMDHPERNGLPAAEVRTIAASIARKPAGERRASMQSDPIAALASRWNRPAEALAAFGATASKGSVAFPMRKASGEVTGYRLRRGDGGTFRGEAKAISKRPEGGDPDSPCNAPIFPWPFPEEGPLLIVEGEHDGAAAVLEIDATVAMPGSSPGAFAWEQFELLAEGRDVLLAADNDAPGEAFAAEVAKRLTGKAASLRRLAIPDGHKDLADALDASPDWRAALRELVESAGEIDGTAASVDGEEWPELVPLGGGAEGLPTLDPCLLGGFAGEYAEALSKWTETPPELAVLTILGACSTAAARRLEVEVKRGYVEPANLWLVAVLEPGSRKSSVHAAATFPLIGWEREEAERLATSIRRAKAGREVLEEKIKAMKAKAARAKDVMEAAALAGEAADLEGDLPEIPPSPILFTGDSTPEALGPLLMRAGERLGWLTSEGGLFEDLAGSRYASKPGTVNLDLALKAWGGDPFRSDRISRQPVDLRHPLLTIAATAQPAALDVLAATGAGRGFAERFLFALPRSPLGYRTGEGPEIPEAIRRSYTAGIEAMLDWPEAPERGLWRVQLDGPAAEAWHSFWRAIEESMRPGGKCEGAKGFAGKFPGQAARLACVLHGIRHAHGRPWEELLDKATMEAALGLAAVLGEHTIAALETLGADEVTGRAARLWAKIEEARQPEFTARDLFNRVRRGGWSTMANLLDTLRLLRERGFIAGPIKPKPEGPGRPPSSLWIVRPELAKGWNP